MCTSSHDSWLDFLAIGAIAHKFCNWMLTFHHSKHHKLLILVFLLQTYKESCFVEHWPIFLNNHCGRLRRILRDNLRKYWMDFEGINHIHTFVQRGTCINLSYLFLNEGLLKNESLSLSRDIESRKDHILRYPSPYKAKFCNFTSLSIHSNSPKLFT